MGISFVYIGRDENTLKDMLPVEKLGDQLPLELGGKSYFGYVPRAAGINKTAMTTMPGFSGVDPESITELQAPLKPLSYASWASWGSPTNKTSILGKITSPSNPETQKLLQALLPTLLPSLPKDFKLSDMFPPGGIVMSNYEVIMAAVEKDHPEWLAGMRPRLRAPKNEAGAAHGAGGHTAMIRSIYGLDLF